MKYKYHNVGTYKSKKELLPGIGKMVAHSESTLKVVKHKKKEVK